MEYFDFENASHMADLEDLSSIYPEVNEEEAESCFEALVFDKTNSLPMDEPGMFQPCGVGSKCDTRNIEVEEQGAFPLLRAKEPCDLCRQRGLDCFIAHRGTLLHGCTCCISLYKECSFTHQTQSKSSFLNTFPGISEDTVVDQGSISGKKALKSVDDSRPRKNSARFRRDAVKILKAWLTDHADRPYPNEREKDDLKASTGLKRSQISNWLANARRRGKGRPASGPTSPILGAIDIPVKGVPGSEEWQNLNPLDRWKVSPPQNEPASVTAIARAVAQAPFPPRNGLHSSLPRSHQNSNRSSSENGSSLSMFQAPSVSSLETGRSSTSDLSFASAYSHPSKNSRASSLGDRDHRRRRRAPVTQRPAAQTAKSRNPRIFQCTFCTHTFAAKYDWQRHEKSLHLALERWTCCPNGGKIDIGATQYCLFCQEANPTDDHLESHDFLTCKEKTLQERTFYRKDHLRQHLKLLHSAKFHPWMEAWKSTTNEIKSRCGFCPQIFATWQQRADHLAAHFRNGSDMRNWSGGWGFEPYVERLVENALPPYLIAQERTTMDPYVATVHGVNANRQSATSLTPGTSTDCSSSYQLSADSNCWRRLERELSAYVAQQKEIGVIPTDQMLQDKGRLIIFDCDDPWNQTAADNRLWLSGFKHDHGIAESPSPSHPPKLEEMPLLPPYAIPGGLKKARTGRSGTGGQIRGCITPVTPAPAFDPAMEIDFDQLDFSNLDLGMIDDPVAAQTYETTGHFQTGAKLPKDLSCSGLTPGFDGFELGLAQIEGNNLMSDQDLRQLSSFMAEF